jgi:hypothetical protein
MGRPIVADSCDFGWVAAWASEMGDADTLGGLLAHADRYMAPTRREGGLYYPRNDTVSDAEGNRTEVEPLTGNVLLGYARLNVPDGLWTLYNEPWESEHWNEPALSEVSEDVDVAEAFFDHASHTLRFAVQRNRERAGDGIVELRNVDRDAEWTFGPGFERDGNSLRCPAGGFHTVIIKLR